MKIRIFQINIERDQKRVAFLGLDNLERFQGSSKVNAAIYDRIYNGEVECESLEDVYRKFNLDCPEGYIGRSMSVSDVVQVVAADNMKPGFYFCDTIGFKEIEFDEDLSDIDNGMIQVVLVEPGKPARVETIHRDLDTMRGIVKGEIDIYLPKKPEEDVFIVCNEDARRDSKLGFNRTIYCEGAPRTEENIIDVLYGPFFICASSNNSFAGSLTFEQLEEYVDMFKEPETEPKPCETKTQKLYTFREMTIEVKGEKEQMLDLAELIRRAGAEGSWADIAFKIENEFDVDGVRSANEEVF